MPATIGDKPAATELPVIAEVTTSGITLSLFDLSVELVALDAQLDQLNAGMPDDAEAQHQAITAYLEQEASTTEKLAQVGDRIATFVRVCEYLEDIAHKEATLFAARAAIYKARGKRIKDTLCRFLNDRNLGDGDSHRIVTGSGAKLWTQKNGGVQSVEVIEGIDPTTLPPRYQKITIEVNEQTLREDLLAGAKIPTVPGPAEGSTQPIARLVPKGKHLRFG